MSALCVQCFFDTNHLVVIEKKPKICDYDNSKFCGLQTLYGKEVKTL